MEARRIKQGINSTTEKLIRCKLVCWYLEVTITYTFSWSGWTSWSRKKIRGN